VGQVDASAGGGDIFTSSNSGATWTDVGLTDAAISGLVWVSVASNSTGTDLVAVVFGGDIWTSSNAGASWADVGLTDTATAGRNWSAVASNSAGSDLVAVVNNGDIWTVSGLP
jgi:hypothetical protein